MSLGLPLDARCGLVRREDVLPAEGALDVRSPVVDFDDRAELRGLREHPLDPIAEARVEAEDLGVGVVEQVEQLVVGVAVVHVDRHASHLERRVLRGDVLDAVVEVERDLRVGLQARGR